MADGQMTGEGDGKEGVTTGISGTGHKESGINENILCIHMLV